MIGCAAAILLACNNDKNPTDPKVAGVSVDSSATKADAWIPVDDSTAMKAMMEAGTPGAEHAWLAKSAGNWKAETTMWMTPDAPPQKSVATVVNKMLMGGRYQQSSWKGTMMNEPFEGMSTVAYDKAKKKWVSTWIDGWSTGILLMEGDWDEATQTATYTGQFLNPANGKMCEMKEIYKVVDDNTHLMEMWGPDMKTGKPYKNMEVKMTRVK
jgi:hypothetical protein